MFFCEPCREYNDWPESMFRSKGACEMCNKQAVCYDVPSGALPPSRAYREFEAKKLAQFQTYRVDEDLFDGVE